MATGAADSPLRINGVTGILSVDADGIIHRELTLARINSGVAAAITP
jgi:outer membrane PBP1 activator LpoA protein